MNIDTSGTSPSGFYIVTREVFDQTRAESDILEQFDLGGIAILFGARYGQPVWLLDNPLGHSQAIWLEE